MVRLRVAWVTPYPPDRDGGGGQIRQAHLLAGLVDSGAEVVLCAPGPLRDPSVRSAIAAHRALPGAPAPRRSQLRRRLDDVAGAVGPLPREARAARRLRSAAAAALASERVDAVVVEYAGLAPLGRSAALRAATGARTWVLTLHNLPSRMDLHHAAVLGHRRQRWLFERDAVLAARLEHRAVAAFDRVVVASDDDAAVLGRPASVTVIGNGVDLRRFTPSPLPPDPTLLFSGALATVPNTDGARWLCGEILPEVRRRVPAATLAVVGAQPPPAVRALADLPGVALHADVASIGPHLAAARACLVPIRIGSGTRLKALEGWAAGRPVVGTTVGLEGLGVRSGRDALVADSAADFAAAIVSVLTDDGLAARLALAGREVVEDRFGWDALAARFVELLSGPANGDRGGPTGTSAPRRASPPA